MKILGAARQSRTADRSISIEAQRQAIETYAASGELVAITEDPSTSGGTSVFDRPGIGPWFRKPDTWQTLAATKLDRLCRDVSDYMKLRDWLRDHGKRLVLLNQPELDESTPTGKLVSSILAHFAEFERDMTKERSRERHAYLTAKGRWPGGRKPFGTLAEHRPDGVYLVTDPDSALPDMIARAIDGESNVTISKWLNDSKIPTQIGRTPWNPATVGLVLKRVAETDEELASALASRAPVVRGQWTSGRHMLLRVAFCQLHGTSLYGIEPEGRTGLYRCMACARSVSKTWLEEQVINVIEMRWGDDPWRLLKVIRGDDHGREISRLERELNEERGRRFPNVAPYEAELERLRALPHEPDRTEWVDQGVTISQQWATLTTAAEKNDFFKSGHIRAEVRWAPGVRRPKVWVDQVI